MTSRAGFRFGVALVALASCLAGTHGFALTFDVDTEVDGPDANPGDGICATLVGPCTLRAAIEEANALGGAHTINLPQGYYHAGNHVVTADISILGPSGLPVGDRPAVIGGGPTFVINIGARLSMADTSILFGDSTSGLTAGCVENAGEFELTNGGLYACTGRIGGAIYNQGTLTMTGCEVEDSDALDIGASGDGGGLYNYSSGTATLTEVVFRRNTAATDGGAIFNLGSLSLIDSWLDDNEAGDEGGGLWSGVEANLTRVTVSRNVCSPPLGNEGGGINAQGTLTLTNVTIHSNTTGGVGGGLFLEFGTFGLVNVTIFNNSDGLATGPDATVQLVNTLFINPPANCSLLNSPVTSFGHNMEAFGGTCGLDGPGDLVNISSLGTRGIGLYGGFGETLLLSPGSTGIDDGDNAWAPPTDQRGAPRVDGDRDGVVTADIGAAEADEIFWDGFESGNTSGWSSTVP